MKLICVSPVEIAKEQIVQRGSGSRLWIDFFICSVVDITLFVNNIYHLQILEKFVWMILSFHMKTFNLKAILPYKMNQSGITLFLTLTFKFDFDIRVWQNNSLNSF